MQKIEMTNKSIARQVRARRKGTLDWIFIPGGPGMGPEYMINLANKLVIDGSITIFEFPNVLPPKITEEKDVFQGWQNDLIELTKILENPVALGHSFGGMFCLGTPELANTLQGLVIVDASPDISYRESYKKEIERLGTPEMVNLDEVFELSPSEENLRNLFVSWAPFFFLNPKEPSNLELLRNHSYNPTSYQICGKVFLKDFNNLWPRFEIPTTLIAGEFDYITPMHLFERVPEFNGVSKAIVSAAGHFPWVENLCLFNIMLQNFEKTFKQAKRAISN